MKYFITVLALGGILSACGSAGARQDCSPGEEIRGGASKWGRCGPLGGGDNYKDAPKSNFPRVVTPAPPPSP